MTSIVTSKTEKIGVIDGLRGFAILLVLWFHFWQISWLSTRFTLFGTEFNFDFIPITGFLGVELFFFVSGFCLFLPYARSRWLDRPLPTLGHYAYRRAIKILPSYWLCMLLLLAFSDEKLGTGLDAIKHILSHLLFVHIWDHQTWGSINGVFWSLGVEVQFYVLFPLVARLFLKRPALAYALLCATAVAYRLVCRTYFQHDYYFWLHQMPAFLDLFANGILASYIVVYLHREGGWLVRGPRVATVLSILGVVIFFVLTRDAVSTRHLPEWSNNWLSLWRFPLALDFLLIAVTSAFAVEAWQRCLSNRLLIFLSVISYNLYLWHQVLGRMLLKWRIPAPLTTDPHDDERWKILFMLAAVALSLGAAKLLTEFFEKPLLKKRFLPGLSP